MKKEFIKVAAATAVSMAAFGIVFIGANHFALASATSNTQPLASAQQHNDTSIVRVVSQEPQTPSGAWTQTNVNPTASTARTNNAQGASSTLVANPDARVDIMPSATPSANAISTELATEIGAQYIFDMFGADIGDKTVHLIYSAHPSMTRTFWRGIVTESGQTDRNNELFEFTLDAVTGQRINISNRGGAAPNMSEEVRAALNEFFQDHSRFEEQLALRQGQPPAQLDAYLQTARNFAALHFNNSEVVNIEFVNSNALSFDLDEQGNLVAVGLQLIFTATDSTGRVADISISSETHELIWLLTESNDIVPGFNYVGSEPGRG